MTKQQLVDRAQFAQIAYSKSLKDGDVFTLDSGRKLTNEHFIRHAATDTQGYVAYDDEEIIIAMRGTESLRDWVTNLGFPMIEVVDWGAGKPRVFGEAFNCVQVVWPQIVAALDNVRDRITGPLSPGSPRALPRRLVCVGHSLGGTEICIVGVQVASQGYARPIVVPFNPARPGDKHFALTFGKVCPDSLLAIHDKDLVSRLPPLILGYRRPDCRALEFEENGEYGPAVDKVLDSINSLLQPREGIADHEMDPFRRSIEKIQEEEI